MGRRRWRERRAGGPVTAQRLAKFDEAEAVRQARPGVIRCGHKYSDDSLCMAPASAGHAATHRASELADELPRLERLADEEAERLATEELLNRADRMVPAKGLAEVVAARGQVVVFDRPGGYVVKETAQRRPTYDVLRAASAERAQFTTDQAKTMLSAALGTRPHLAARVIEKLGPVLAGELARAVDASVEGRISGYLSAERAELNRLYQDQAAKLSAEREGRGRDVNSERWTTPSRLS
jgi:hypothetical protein